MPLLVICRHCRWLQQTGLAVNTARLATQLRLLSGGHALHMASKQAMRIDWLGSARCCACIVCLATTSLSRCARTDKQRSTGDRCHTIACLLQSGASDNLELMTLTALQRDCFSFSLSLSPLLCSALPQEPTSSSGAILDHV